MAIESVQQIDRTQHTTSSGMEIVRTFHIRPYNSHPDLTKALQGFVEPQGNRWRRTPPTMDPYIKVNFCNEALVKFAHPDAMTTSENVQEFVGEDGTTKEKLEGVPETTETGAAGAIVQAHFRPLITAYRESASITDDDGNDGETSRWDWLDPTIVPGVRQVPWPEGLHVTAFGPALGNPLGGAIGLRNAPRSVPDSVSSPIAVPVHNVSIRRILVGKVPWDRINKSVGATNDALWPAAGHPAAGQLPRFRPNTLKMLSANTKNMIDSEGNRWYEITYNFQWISFVTDALFDENGSKDAGHVTWDHILIKPNLGAEVGWYRVYRDNRFQLGPLVMPAFIPALIVRGGLLHNQTDFTDLFKLNP